MNKKMVGILICTLLITTTVLPVVLSLEKKIDIISIKEKSTEDCNCHSNILNTIGGKIYVMSETLIPPTTIIDDIPQTSTMDLPDYFNWMDYEGYDWTTPAKDQGNCGSCWDFAAIGALESRIKIKEGLPNLNVDLSEQYVLSCLPDASNYYGEGCNGGDPYNAYDCIMNYSERGNYCNGIIPELCFPYEANHNVPCTDKWENWEEYLIPITNCDSFWATSWLDRDLDKIKNAVIEEGPVAAGINVTTDFGNWGYTNHSSPTDYYPYSNPGPLRFLNHIIVIVGWKDDSSITNGGYWICKNSWGTEWGYDGFFNIEYGGLFCGYYNAYASYDPGSYDWHPVPETNGPYYGLVNDPVQFNGDAAGEHPPFIYQWDFGDDKTADEQNPTHIYESPGEYNVRLTVSDADDNSFYNETTVWIQETNSPPNTPIIEGPSRIKKEEYCWYNITFSDPDNSMLYLYVDMFGLEPNNWWSYPPNHNELNVYYFWPEEGDFTVRAKVKDPYGVESDWATLEVRVSKTKTIIPYSVLIERLIERSPFFEMLINLDLLEKYSE
jgi:C1A family cysteine protease